MVWHYNRCVKFVTYAIVMQTVLEDDVPGLRSERNSSAFAECHEYHSSGFLIVRQVAVVSVFSLQRWF